MVISMSFSEFASTFFERPLRRDRLILWCGMVFFHDFDQWFACPQVILKFFFGAERVWVEPATPDVAGFFRILLAESCFNTGSRNKLVLPGETFWAHEENQDKNIFKTNISKHVFEQTTAYFWRNNNLFLNTQGSQQLKHKMFASFVLTLSCLGCQTVPCLTMIKHRSWFFFWAKLASRVPSDEARQISHDWDPVIWNLWHYLFLAALVFEQPICETQLFDTWVHAACMVWSALIFLSWWKETVWI